MYETEDDLAGLDALLERSYEGAGAHLLEVITPERRLGAATLAELLTGVNVLVLATVTGDGRPLCGPVDGLFYRGSFWFGSAHGSVRFRHLRRRPHVSGTHTRGEELAITVHGTAEEVDLASDEHAGFRAYCVETYGESWGTWGFPVAYARIDASKMFVFSMPAGG